MMRYARPMFFLSLVAVFALSCKKENKIPVITVSPTAADLDVFSGDVVAFRIQGRSDNSTLTRLVITSKKGNGFTTTIVDSTISGTAFNWDWEYFVANAIEDYTELLTFRLYDADGALMDTQRTLYVTLAATVLTETTGHQFYSRNSGLHTESAVDLQDRVQVLYTAA